MELFSSLTLDFDAAWQLVAWTMVHFLWVGGLIAAVGGILRLALRRAGAQVRYLVSLTALGIFAVTPVVVAFWLLPVPSEKSSDFAFHTSDWDARGLPSFVAAETASTLPDAVLPRKKTPDPVSVAQPQESEPRALHHAPRPALETIVASLPYLWLVGTPCMLLLLATGLTGGARLRRRSRTINHGAVIHVLECLRQNVRGRAIRRLAVAVCDRVASPVLVGIVRPLVLLPPAALTGWSPEQIEMVLLHEVAHVRRWDNLVNLLQRLVESLLFFHPAVWWLSGWVRQEREHCCDAFVVRYLERDGRRASRRSYARLLLDLAAANRASPLAALGAAFAARNLRSRVRHILNMEEQPMRVSLRTLFVILALATLTVVVTATAARGLSQDPGREDEEEVAGQEESAPSTDPAPRAELHRVPEAELSDDVLKDVPSAARFTPEGEAVEFLLNKGRVNVQAWQLLGMNFSDEGGALKILALRPDGPAKAAGLRDEDFVIGLADRRTTSFVDLNYVLDQIEANSITPIKVYVVRDRRDKTVYSGTLALDWDEIHRARQEEPSAIEESVKVEEDETGQPEGSGPSLTYDGKDFQYWKNTWRTELKTERRTEAIRALAAFGAHGYGREAAETILDVVKVYHPYSYAKESPEKALVDAAVDAMAGKGVHVPLDEGLAVLADGVTDSPRLAKFAELVVMQLRSDAVVAVPHLLEMSTAPARDNELARRAIGKLSQMHSRLPREAKEELVETFREALKSPEPEVAGAAMQALYPAHFGGGGGYGGGYGGYGGGGYGGGYGAPPENRAGYVPELLHLLQGSHPIAAMQVLQGLGEQAEAAVPSLVEMLNIPQAHAALAALSGVEAPRNAAEQELQRVVIEQWQIINTLRSLKAAPEEVFAFYVQQLPGREGKGFVRTSMGEEQHIGSVLVSLAADYGKKAQPVVPKLLPLLVDEELDERGRVGVVEAIWHLTGSLDQAEAYLEKTGAQSPENVAARADEMLHTIERLRELIRAGKPLPITGRALQEARKGGTPED